MNKLIKGIAIIAFGVIAVCGFALLFRYAVLTSGPFSDAQIQATAVVPIENIRISMAGRLSVLWKVDDRFELKCGDEFTIRKGAKMSDFPGSWVVRDYTGEVKTAYGSHLFYIDNVSDQQSPYIYAETNEEREIVGVIAFCNGRRGLRIVDLKSSKQISLYGVRYEELEAFFLSLPQ